MEFEDILLEVGDYGRYQKNMILIFLLPAASLLPWFTMNIMFMVSVPDHWCNVPELVSSNLTLALQRLLVSPPGEKCAMYNISYAELLESGSYTIPNGTETMPCNNGWQYDQTDYDSTAATQWNMVCEDAHYTSFVLTLFNVGSIIGTPIYGALSDKIGRKITFFITIIVTAVTAITSVLMSNFTAFVVIKTINGSLMPCVFQLPFIIILEIVAPEVRTRMNGLVNCAWTFGLCFLPLIAYLTRGWYLLGLITSSVTIIFFFYWTFLPESPRWLVSVERYEEAADVLVEIGKKNKQPKEKSHLIPKLKKLGDQMKREKEVDGVQNNSADILRYAQLRKKFIIITICWMSNIMAYYGLQLNVSNLAGNEFINFFLLSLVEVPGYLTCWYFMEKFGRRWCTVFGFFLTGIFCMLPIWEFPYSDVTFSMIGKFFASGTFMATYQQSSELYPTVVRSLAMGMSSTVASVATLIVPYLVYLSIYGKAIPFVIIGGTAMIAGVLAAFLPETLNENLPQTIFDAEKFGKDQKFLSWNRRRRSVSRERALSIAKTKAVEAEASEENVAKRSSGLVQNIEYTPVLEISCVSPDSVKILNGIRKRNSSELSNKEHMAISLPSKSRITPNPSQKDSESQKNQESQMNPESLKNPEPQKNSEPQKNEDVGDSTVVCDPERKLSYVNMVFEGIDEDVVKSKATY